MTCFHFFNICIHISICTYKHSYVLMYIQFRNTELRNGAARKPSLSFGPSNQHPAHPLGVVVFVVAATATVTANNIAYSLQRATAREWGERKKKKSEPTRALIVRLSKTRARPPYGSPCCCCPTSESKTHARPPRVVQVQDNSESVRRVGTAHTMTMSRVWECSRIRVLRTRCLRRRCSWRCRRTFSITVCVCARSR